MSAPDDMLSAGFVALVKALGTTLGKRRGWQARVAGYFGVHPTYISKIDRGVRHAVGPAVTKLVLSRNLVSEETLADLGRSRDGAVVGGSRADVEIARIAGSIDRGAVDEPVPAVPGRSACVAAEQYRRLVEAMGAGMGHSRGWKTRVAARLGVSPSYVSKVASGHAQHVGADPIAKAKQRLGLSDDYFATEGMVPAFGEGLDAETSAMATLAALPDDARRRVLAWAAERWGR